MINIKGISREKVLVALYNSANTSTGAGFFVTIFEGPIYMSEMEALLLFLANKENGHFDSINKRVIGVSLPKGVEEFDPRLYDQDNGGDGTAQRIINELRAELGLA